MLVVVVVTDKKVLVWSWSCGDLTGPVSSVQSLVW